MANSRTAAGIVDTSQEIARDERIIWVRRRSQQASSGSNNSTTIPLKVKLGISDGVRTEILAGDLHIGDEVVVEAEIQKGAS